MAHTLKIATGVSLAMLWPFTRNRQRDKLRSIGITGRKTNVFVRHCPICGHETSQHLIEERTTYASYWCAECGIPHDVECPPRDSMTSRVLRTSSDKPHHQRDINRPFRSK